jgi:uncharacterized membrane protein
LDEKLVLFLIYFIFSLLLAGLSVPLIQGKVKPNHRYGFRVTKTISNDKIWYATNRYAGRRLLATGLLTALIAAALYFSSALSTDGYGWSILAVLGVILTVSVVQSLRLLRKL